MTIAIYLVVGQLEKRYGRPSRDPGTGISALYPETTLFPSTTLFPGSD